MPFYFRSLSTAGSYLFAAALAGMLGSASCLAETTSEGDGLNVTLKANIVENTCQISLSNNGTVHLPTVSRHWFYNNDGTARLQPTDAASGTIFSVNIESCSGDVTTVNTMTFGFQPQDDQWPTQSKQVFINEVPSASGGAENVGVVIFASVNNRNVLESDGSSAVIVDVSNASTYLTQYDFYARYQNTGTVSAGKVTSHVLVDAIYQ